MSRPSYTCECPVKGRALYAVTDHDGVTSTVAYCEDCAALARIDWNGETSHIIPQQSDSCLVVRTS